MKKGDVVKATADATSDEAIATYKEELSMEEQVVNYTLEVRWENNERGNIYSVDNELAILQLKIILKQKD